MAVNMRYIVDDVEKDPLATDPQHPPTMPQYQERDDLHYSGPEADARGQEEDSRAR